MKILILNWKDIHNPNAGGSEIVIHELAKRLVRDNNSLTFLTSAFNKSKSEEIIDGIKVIRVGGNRYSHPFKAIDYYRKNLKGKNDIIIECVNTAPYLINFFKRNEKVFLFYHQLAREIWFYETKFPLNIIGYLIEPIYTFIQSRFKNQVITVSNSSKQDLAKYGFNPKFISIVTQGTVIYPCHSDSAMREKNPISLVTDPSISRNLGITQDNNYSLQTTNSEKPRAKSYILYLGSLRAMKRPMHSLRSFQILNSKFQIPNFKLFIAGSGPQNEINKLKNYIKNNKLDEKVELLGRVDERKKVELLKNAFALVVPSLKEGWGLIVTEAAKVGTPSIVYNVDGLRDSVKDGITGYIVENGKPEKIVEKIIYLQENPEVYKKLCENCIKYSEQNTFENSYKDFKQLVISHPGS